MKLHLKSIVAALLALGTMPTAGFAAATAWQEMAGGRVRLVIADPKPGEAAVRGMLQVEPAPGWKTYWRDPGDAGVPLQIDFGKSDNAALASIDFPAPDRFDDGVTVWAGYKHPVAFGLTLTRTNTAKPVRVAGGAFLGVCDAICVPVQFDFDLTAQDAAAPTMHQELVSMALADLPKAADGAFGISKAVVSDKTLTVTVALPAASSDVELFVAAPNPMQFGAPVLKAQDGATATFEAPVLMHSRALPAGPQVIGYTLKTAGGAVSGEAELTRP